MSICWEKTGVPHYVLRFREHRLLRKTGIHFFARCSRFMSIACYEKPASTFSRDAQTSRAAIPQIVAGLRSFVFGERHAPKSAASRDRALA
jgi:hypothetical protein